MLDRRNKEFCESNILNMQLIASKWQDLVKNLYFLFMGVFFYIFALFVDKYEYEVS